MKTLFLVGLGAAVLIPTLAGFGFYPGFFAWTVVLPLITLVIGLLFETFEKKFRAKQLMSLSIAFSVITLCHLLVPEGTRMLFTGESFASVEHQMLPAYKLILAIAYQAFVIGMFLFILVMFAIRHLRGEQKTA